MAAFTGRESGEIDTVEYKYLTEVAIPALFGQLGADSSLAWRNVSSWMIVYQNIRLLGFVLFSSLVDPSLIISRGGLKQTWNGLKEQIKGENRAKLIEQLQLLGFSLFRTL